MAALEQPSQKAVWVTLTELDTGILAGNGSLRARDMPVSRLGAANRNAASGRTKDFIIYCLIAILVVAILGLYGFYGGKLGHTSGLSVKWLGFGIMTAFVFGNTIRYSGRLWRVRKFWVLLGFFPSRTSFSGF